MQAAKTIATATASAGPGELERRFRLTKEAEAAALPILLRHSPGMVLPERTYLLSEDALRALRRAGVPFVEVGREAL